MKLKKGMGKKEKMIQKEELVYQTVMIIFLSFVILLFMVSYMSFEVSAADPQGPDDVINPENRTKGNVSARMINISGGYIGVYNLNATMQNTRWKAFIGNVTGMFTLDDAGGSTIYDWTLSSISGRVYATRNSSTIIWGNVNCSNLSLLEQENINMEHSSSDDNITATFNTSANATHAAFYVSSTLIYANTCPTLNTYRNNASNDNYWEEMALYESTGENTIYATIIDDDEVGYDGATYDFQMIVPENGNSSFSGATAYYIYLEIS